MSGGFSLEGMFWYYRVPDPDTWGAYARVEVCWVEVFNGSLWVSVGTDGIDGGTGRNDYYDGLIDEARNMADQMNQARDDLLDELDDAFLELVRLSDEQRQAAALALVERSGIIGGLIEIIFQYNELDNWEGNLPPALDLVYNELFGGDQNALVQARTELNNIQNQINNNLDSLETIQQSVAVDLENYQALWQEELPDIQDLGTLGNPFQGMQTTVVNVGGVSKTVTVGFQINEGQADSQREKLSSIREDFAEYQEAFIEQAGIIDAKLQMVDDILFENEQNLSALNQAYGTLYARMGGYVDRFVGFQDENYKNAVDSLARLQTAVINIPIIGSKPLEVALNYALQMKAGALSSSNPSLLNNWNNERIGLINALVTTGGGPSYSVPQDIINQGPTEVFKETGLELWHRIPITGFEASRDQSPQRKDQALQTFKGSSGAFRGKWASATELTDTVFGRKSDLYDILYEIYDQLAAYGSGLNSISASEPLVIDQTPPTGISLSAASEQISRTTLKVRVTAADSESGIASYRYAVWELGNVSMRNGGEAPTRLRSPEPGSSNPGGYYAIPVAGFLAEGAFQGTTQSQGHQFQQYQQSDSGLTSEGQQYQLSPGLTVDIPPWFESGWEGFSGGANPESIDLEIGITGFPGSGLSFGKRYQVKLWVMNGAGLTRYAGAVIIKTVNVYSGPTMEGSQQGSQQAVPGGGIMLIP